MTTVPNCFDEQSFCYPANHRAKAAGQEFVGDLPPSSWAEVERRQREIAS